MEETKQEWLQTILIVVVYSAGLGTLGGAIIALILWIFS